MVNILIVAIGLPLGIILVFTLMSRYPDRVEGWMPWVWGVMLVSQTPILYENIAVGRYGIGFWSAIVIAFTAACMVIHSIRQRATR